MDYPTFDHVPVVNIKYHFYSVAKPTEFELTLKDQTTIKLIMNGKTAGLTKPPTLENKTDLVCYAPAKLTSMLRECCVINATASNVTFTGSWNNSLRKYIFRLQASDLPITLPQNPPKDELEPGQITGYQFTVDNTAAGDFNNENFAYVTFSYAKQPSFKLQTDIFFGKPYESKESYFCHGVHHLTIAGTESARLGEELNKCQQSLVTADVDRSGISLIFDPQTQGLRPYKLIRPFLKNCPGEREF